MRKRDSTTNEIESAILADIGNAMTTAGLIDLVEGKHRLLARGCAPTTITPPYADVAVGVREAVGQIERLAGRNILTEGGQLISPERQDGRGVDTAAITCSGGTPIRLAITGLSADLSVRSATKVATSTYANIVATINMVQGSSSAAENGHAKNWVELLSQARPELILMTGGVDDGPVLPLKEIAHTIMLAANTLPEPARPTVIFAGNKAARQVAADILSNEVPFQVVDNVRPSWDKEQLEPAAQALSEFYRSRRITRLPGMGAVRALTPAPILSTVEAFSWAMAYLAQQEGTSVLGIDMGATTLCLTAQIQGVRLQHVNREAGIRCAPGKLVDRIGIENIMRWLPDEMSPDDLANQIANMNLYPLVQPQTREQFWIQQAVIREALHFSTTDFAASLQPLHNHPQPIMVDYLLVSGNPLTRLKAAHVALAVLDGVQPTGITHLLADRFNLVSPVIALAQVAPVAAAHVLVHDVLASIGTLIVPTGRMKPGKTALRCDLTYPDGSAFRLEIPFGTLEVIPLQANQELQIDIHPARELDLGLGAGKRVQTGVKGGALGMIIDARGRPLDLPSDDETRRTTLMEWQQYVGA